MPYPRVTGEGNLTADPELKWLESGNVVANVSVASTQRTKNKQTGEWEDEGTTFLRLALWNEDAEALAEWATRGAAVRYEGQLVVREFEARDGGKGTSVELKYPVVVPDPKRMVITATRRQRDGQQGGGGQQRQNGGQGSRSGGGGQSRGWGGSGGQQRQQGGQQQQGMQPGSGWGRTARGGQQQQQQQQGGAPDPWASAPAGNGPAAAQGYDDEPPF